MLSWAGQGERAARCRAAPSTLSLISRCFAVLCRASRLFVQRFDRLAAGVPGADFVPVRDALLAQLPAEVNVARFVPADEVDQADLVVLQLAADFGKFVHVV